VTVTVRFFGTGNAFADGGRSHACIGLEAPGASLLFDCGGSSLPAIKKAIDPATIQAIAISHLHGDHFGGIPYLVMEQHFAGRIAPLAIGGPRELRERATRAGEALFMDFFGTDKIEYRLTYVALGETPVPLGGAEVSAHPVQHVPAREDRRQGHRILGRRTLERGARHGREGRGPVHLRVHELLEVRPGAPLL